MELATFSTKWFALYYTVLGVCLLGAGGYLILKNEQAASFLIKASENEKPPPLFIRILKYFLLFTFPGLVLSFMPFSWIELLFTLWSLLLVYIAGLQLVRWEQNRKLLRTCAEELASITRRCGAIMVAVGFTIFLLTFLVINRTPL